MDKLSLRSYLLPAAAVVSVLSLFTFSASAQSNRIDTLSYKCMEPSPRASALLRYGEYGLDAYSGLPVIEIPVWTIKTPWCEVPVSFRYRGGGIKYDDISGELGLGWDLVAGGVVTQEIRGMDDLGGWWDYVRRAGVIDVTDLYGDYAKLRDVERGYRMTQEQPYDAEYMRDGEHDIFSYSCPGGSGKFILPKDNAVENHDINLGNPMFIPVNGWKAYASQSYVTLTDTDGTVYRFERMHDGTTGEFNPRVAEFYLVSITRRGGTDSITFSYTTGDYYSNYTKKPAILYSQTVSERFVASVDYNGCGTHSGPTVTTAGYTTELRVSTPRLDRITFRGGRIEFVYFQDDDDDRSESLSWDLRRVDVYDAESSLVQSTVLTKESVYSYEEQDRWGYPEVFLKKVETGYGGTLRSWTMDYYTTHRPVCVQPIYGTSYQKGVDYWGYFTGRTVLDGCFSPSIVPKTVISEKRLDRSPVEEWTKAGILTTITYAGGGRTEFEWEPNYCGMAMGGLRIKSIAGYDRDSTMLTWRRYSYPESRCRTYLSSQDFTETVRTLTTNPPAQSGQGVHLCTYTDETRVLPFPKRDITYEGHSVVYPRVREYRGRDSSSEDAYTEYTFTFTEDEQYTWGAFGDTFRPGSFDRPIRDLGWMRGRLLSKSEYWKRPDGTWTGIRTEHNTWRVRDSLSVTNLRVRRPVLFAYGNGADVFDHCGRYTDSPSWYRDSYPYNYLPVPYDWFNYFLTSGYMELAGTEEYSDGVTTVREYDWNDACLKTGETMTSSDGSTIRSETEYVYEHQSSYPMLYGQNGVGVVLGRKEWRDTTLLYSENVSLSPTLVSGYPLWLPSSVTVTGHTGSEDAPSESVSFSTYDPYGNVWSVTGPDGVCRTYLWGICGTRPIVGIEGASLGEVMMKCNGGGSVISAGAQAVDTALVSIGARLRDSLSTALVTVNSYQPLVGMISSSAPSGRARYWSWYGPGYLESESGMDGRERDYVYDPVNGSIRSRTYTSQNMSGYYDDWQWHDGLGRPNQQVSTGAGPNGNDVVTVSDLDGEGRPWRTSVPAEYGSGGTRKDTSAVFSSLRNRWNDGKPWSETILDGPFLSRETLMRLPGDSLYGKPSTVQYGANTAGELLAATVSDSGTIVWKGPVPAAVYYKSTATDADGRTMETFTDREGRVVLERRKGGVGSSAQTADTYHFYDAAGRERWILSPEGSSRLVQGSPLNEDSLTVRAYAHVRTYDKRDRVIRDRKPGCGWTEYIYDNNDRLSAWRDAVMTSGNRWMVIGYDNLGRETWTGLLNYQVTRSQLQSIANGSNREGLFLQAGGVIHTRTRYDTYPDNMPYALHFNEADSGWDFPESGMTKGLVTYTETAVIDGYDTVSGYVRRAYWYDRRGRLVQTGELWPSGETRYQDTRYDYAGRVSEALERYSPAGGGQDQTVDTQYTLDSRGRVQRSSTWSGSGQSMLDYEYDEQSRPVKVGYGRPNGAAAPIAEESICYDIRGWRTGSVVREGTDTLLVDSLGYFGQGSGAAAPSYTGRITRWSGKDGGGGRSYEISYDGLGRLSGASLWQNGTMTDSDTETGVSWDLDGRLLGRTLREGGSLTSQSLIYDSLGRLLRFGNSWNYYYWDTCGRMTTDGLHQAWLSYNVLGKIYDSQVNYNEAGKYSYLADGTKAKAYRSGADSLLYRGGMVLRKSGSAVTFEGASVPGGRIVAAAEAGGTGSGNKMLYYIADHLGSTRLILDGSNGNVMERMTYTPMGRKWATTSSLSTNRYRYNGKEEQALPAGLPYTDYGARFFDSDAYTWLTPDPLSSKYPGINPYAFCGGDPVNTIDPQGDSLYVLFAENGAKGFGHLALLIVDEETGEATIYSNNGEHWSLNYGYNNDAGTIVNDINSFINGIQNCGEDGETYYYTEAYGINNKGEKDEEKARSAMMNALDSYSLLFHNCSQSVKKALKEAGYGYEFPMAFLPKLYYKRVKALNPGGTVVKLSPKQQEKTNANQLNENRKTK